ncbi:MAG: bifunctional diaminohydroxyphosphoribosylaminopyrimidine deaminase/5-amino-6-(5-phosphoribosylamino)uracil reductase RibD [Lachnospiraceae bacterium]|nr:bifunctional diaminohydroxyphosphoribosylaminopyrimidine deaminase/5-amino-6-(5-phosphoribosylamino)uracil reductase RibD [Lachnospiraceae bacterium]
MEQFMRRAIELAKKGGGWVHPNPYVGAVIVKDGRIIGEGYHKRCGDLHAERNAFANLTESAEGATMYVTLEPCCHQGKQPPCTKAIIEHQIKHVVIGSRDPNPLVSGKGVAQLKEAGIEVTEDFLREECDALNPIFFHYMNNKRPFVTMKYAQSLDGKIAAEGGNAKWISGEESRRDVQALRSDRMGIMVGINTVLADNPRLNCRMDDGRNPIRIIMDRHLRIPEDSLIVQTAGEQETLICTVKSEKEAWKQRAKRLENAGIKLLPQSEDIKIPQVLKELGQLGIDSILIEGGATLNASVIQAGCVDELIIYLAPKFLGAGGLSPVENLSVTDPNLAKRMKLYQMENIGDDVKLVYREV